MKKDEKRGLSTIIATLLIILLVIISIVIVWTVVKNVIVKGSDEISLDKLTIDLEILSFTNDSNFAYVKVKRNPGEGELEGIVFVILDEEGNSYTREVKNVSLKQLETKTFSLDYTGPSPISQISIYPLFLTESGKEIQGGLGDTYYSGGGSSGNGGSGCTPDCINKECGSDGCGGSCGGCPGGSCYLDKKCCPTGYHSTDGVTCTPDCDPIANCIGRQCGSNGCVGGGMCLPYGDCKSPPFGPTFYCNATFMCEECTPDCTGRTCGPSINLCGDSVECGNCTEIMGPTYNCNMSTFSCEVCTPDCSGGRDCGNALNGCGTCGDNDGDCTGSDVCISGICTPPETAMNTGTVLSVWPIPIGHNFLTGNNLPVYDPEGEGYNLNDANYIKIISSYSRCYSILELEYPINPGQYTVIKVSTGATDIEIGDAYELWETHPGCTGS